MSSGRSSRPRTTTTRMVENSDGAARSASVPMLSLVGGGLADLGLLVGVPDGLEALRDGPFVEELLRPGDERDVAEDVG